MRSLALAGLGLSFGCNGLGRPGGPEPADEWAAEWADHMLFRQLDAAALSGNDFDLDAAPEGMLDLDVDADGAVVNLTLSETEDGTLGATLLTAELTVSSGINVIGLGGSELDRSITLLADPWTEGEAVKSGDYRCTPTRLDLVETYYGTFEGSVLEIEIDGPADGALTGLLRLVPGVGPVHLSLGGDAGDLAWYKP